MTNTEHLAHTILIHPDVRVRFFVFVFVFVFGLEQSPSPHTLLTS